MNFDTVDYIVPAHWLSAIVNGDESSFDYYDDDADYESYKLFCEHDVRDAIVEVISEDSYLAHYHDARGYGVLPCSCVDCKFHYPVTAGIGETTTGQLYFV